MANDIDLGRQLEAVVDDLIAKGRYRSRSEVLREGVRLVQERETRLAALEAALAEGLADIEAGRIYPMEEVFAELEAELELLSNPAAGLAEE
ncbi:type II toxin-antitoxin system ParD family antitoxin [Caulobacter sp.]|uniref:type II toxin-antitoxin system ParD family antitoxin n=1 Tax=Caulobacter sp. TaxID=78 RepID=UPI001B05D35D|nr:type II toxin-antitoxin system ParD family antitoxin [Caulobacter sp.]MBO9544638.1 type II toxin-antitoxin system ParD family antitoxin [Caulobacter sp.]